MIIVIISFEWDLFHTKRVI